MTGKMLHATTFMVKKQAGSKLHCKGCGCNQTSGKGGIL